MLSQSAEIVLYHRIPFSDCVRLVTLISTAVTFACKDETESLGHACWTSLRREEKVSFDTRGMSCQAEMSFFIVFSSPGSWGLYLFVWLVGVIIFVNVADNWPLLDVSLGFLLFGIFGEPLIPVAELLEDTKFYLGIGVGIPSCQL